jgi:hypothetical protein
VTSITSDSKVQIAFTPPDDRGDTITSYSIMLEKSDGSYLADHADCDGSSITVQGDSYC